jgi:hypothetical protein
MASIGKDKNGRKRILFVDKEGKRKTVRLSKVSLSLAGKIKVKVEALDAASRSGHSWDAETADWLAKIGNGLHARLAAVGLVPPREEDRPVKLAEFVDQYLASRPDLKPNTIRNMRVEMGRLIAYFGNDRDARRISISEAEEFAARIKQNYAPATAGRLINAASSSSGPPYGERLWQTIHSRKFKVPIQAMRPANTLSP